MRHALAAAAAAAAAALLVPSVAAARPLSAGVNLGVAQSKLDGEAGQDADHTFGLFGRIGLTGRLAGQLEVSRIKSEQDASTEVRTGTALLVVELGSRGAFVPLILVGIGVDKASETYAGSQTGSHIEGGFGLEYRAQGGLTLGVDVRMGGRSVDQSKEVAVDGGQIALWAPGLLDEGEYRSARLTLGVRF